MISRKYSTPPTRILSLLAYVAGVGGAMAQAPANDNFAAAEVITAVATTLTGTNVGATVETGEPATHFTATATAAGVATGRSVWYVWTPNFDGLASYTVVGDGVGAAALATHSAAYTGAGLTSLVRVASASSTAGTATANAVGFASNVFEARNGVPVYFQVTGANGTATTAFTISLKRNLRDGRVVLPRYSNWEWLHPLDGVDPTVHADWATTWKVVGNSTNYGVTPATVTFNAAAPSPLGFAGLDGAPGIKTAIGTPGTAAANTVNNAAYFRTTFTLANATSNLWAQIMVDDGAYIYIDGKQGVPVNIAAKLTGASTVAAPGILDFRAQDGVFFTGAIPTAAGAGTTLPGCRAYTPANTTVEREVRYVFLGGVTGKLDAGQHTIAVSLHQTGVTSSDNAMDLQLIDMGAYPLSDGSASIAFTETPYTGAAANVIPVVEHHDAPNPSDRELAWFCFSPTTTTRQGAVISNADTGNQKALLIRNASAENFVTEPIYVEGINQFVASIRIRSTDTSSGFEPEDTLRVYLETSEDGVNFSEPASKLEIQPLIGGPALTTAFNAGFVTKVLPITANTSKYVRLVAKGVTNSDAESIYLDDPTLSLCRLDAAVTNLVYLNGGNDIRSDDTVSFDLVVTAFGTTGTTFTTTNLGEGKEITGTHGQAVPLTFPATDANGVRQNVVLNLAVPGDPNCLATATVTVPACAVSAVTFTNPVRGMGPDPALVSDDTLTFDVLATGTANGLTAEVRSSDVGNTTLFGSVAFNTAGSITVPATTTSLTVVDKSDPACLRTVALNLANVAMAIGTNKMGTTPSVLYSVPQVTPTLLSEWRQATTAPANSTVVIDPLTSVFRPVVSPIAGALETGWLLSQDIAIPGGSGALVSFTLKAFESSAGSGFEATDTFQFEVLQTTEAGEAPVNITVGNAADVDGNGSINGFTATAAATYDANRASDEFNRDAQAEAGRSQGSIAFAYVVPAGVTSIRLRAIADNDSTNEFYFIQNLTVGPNGDTDNDGMDDSWELTNFGTLARTGTEDFDADGQADAAEFLAGTDPKALASTLRIQIIERNTTNTTVTVGFASVAAKAYRVQSSPDLRTWTDVGTRSESAGANTSITVPAAGPVPYFYRVKVVP